MNPKSHSARSHKCARDSSACKFRYNLWPSHTVHSHRQHQVTVSPNALWSHAFLFGVWRNVDSESAWAVTIEFLFSVISLSTGHAVRGSHNRRRDMRTKKCDICNASIGGRDMTVATDWEKRDKRRWKVLVVIVGFVFIWLRFQRIAARRRLRHSRHI